SGIVAVGGTPASSGAAFTSVTLIEMAASVFVTPSVTRTLNGYVPGPCASVGVQVNTPLDSPMLAPAGPLSSEKLSDCAGRSLSVAVAVNVYAASSGMVAVGGTPASTGAAFTSVTVTEMAASVFVTPSDTRTLNGYTPGPCASLGVQLKTPLLAPMLAPAGPLTSENVSVCTGRSESVAVAVNVYGPSSGIVAVAGTAESTGATFVFVTVKVIAASVFVTPSLTRTVNG